MPADRLSIFAAAALKKRKARWGTTVTYSRKAFIPLTKLCRDDCGYCTYAKKPHELSEYYLSGKNVVKLAINAEKMGCKEALFSLGERPEKRYEEARTFLLNSGYRSTAEYLRDMAALVMAHSTLIPHLNPGTLDLDELEMLKPVCGSMGMMLESTSTNLIEKGMCHYRCPDKIPERRIETIQNAGKLNIPFTTGILIGIGETWEDRIHSFQVINEINREYGHIQEVLVQNFRSKPGIIMEGWDEPDFEDLFKTIVLGRLILDENISLQVPPNLSEGYEDLLLAGLNDWGGISPLTRDHINPERAWPEIAELKKYTAKKGFTLTERLTVYPEYIRNSNFQYSPAIQLRLDDFAGDDGYSRVQLTM